MLSIVIPTLQKKPEILNLLLNTLINDKCVGEIIIIDNSLKGIDVKHEKIRVIIPKENLFVNPSWNLGVKEAKYDKIGLLNDDIAICKDYCTKISSLMKENMGIIGPAQKNVIIKEKISDLPKENNAISLKKQTFLNLGFGIAMFFYKSAYFEIPDEIKVVYGDNWIFCKCKQNNLQNYNIISQDIFHYGALSSSNPKLKPICKKDSIIYRKATLKWHHRLCSFEENWDNYKIRLFGITFKIKK